MEKGPSRPKLGPDLNQLFGDALGEPTMGRIRLTRVTQYFGAALIIAGTWVYGHSEFRESHTNWTPVTLPLSLVPGTIRTPEFVTDRDDVYEIRLEFDNAPGAEKIGCYPLAPKAITEACEQAPPLLDVSWQLFEGDKRVSAGNSPRGGIVYGAPIWLTIGDFKGRKKHRYVLVLFIKRDASELVQTHPRVVVGISRWRYEGIGLRVAVEQAEGIALGLLGILLLPIPWFVRRLKRTVDGLLQTGR